MEPSYRKFEWLKYDNIYTDSAMRRPWHKLKFSILVLLSYKPKANMVISVLLRNYKTYQNINYIPLSAGQRFCGIVGTNGVGKSSVLESLDTFFNGKEWIWNISTKKQGYKARPYIVPIFLVPKGTLPADVAQLADDISKIMWDIEEKDINSANKPHFEPFKRQREFLKRDNFPATHYLIPIGRDIDGGISFSIFNCYKIAVALKIDIEENATIRFEQLQDQEVISKLLHSLVEYHEYLYIPKDIDPKSFVKLETQEIQVLMGTSLNKIIDSIVTKDTYTQINDRLLNFLDSLTKDLEGYSFRKPSSRQSGVRKGEFSGLIIEHFFETRKLHKEATDGNWIDIKDLSSGEKQKAIIDLAYSMIAKHRANSDKLMLAIDEPESSLHISSCFNQFLNLQKISQSCHQLFFTTHWYGFFPAIDNGFVTAINRRESQHQMDFINLSNYREEIKQQKEDTKGKLPFDIRLKSINDFSQSILASLMSETPFNWIICEGSSEKIYLEEYMADLISTKNLRIIPVGGASEIKRIYEYLTIAYEDFKKELRGKVFMLSDTDKMLISYDTHSNQPNLISKRIVNDEGKKDTSLVNMNSKQSSPQTEIEDCLVGSIFHAALLKFKASYEELEFLSDDIDYKSELNSFFYLNLRPSEREILERFFNTANNKWEFANTYIEILRDDELIGFFEHRKPNWLPEIVSFFN